MPEQPRRVRVAGGAGSLAAVLLVVVGLFGVGAVGVRCAASVNPQATRPCDPAFADRLWKDPLLTQPAPGDVGVPEDGDGGCQDSDSGGVSYAEQTRITTGSPMVVAEHFAAAARRLGWEGVRGTVDDDVASAYIGAGVCAQRSVEGHNVDFNLAFLEDTLLPDGQRAYQLSLAGDGGDFPNCLTD